MSCAIGVLSACSGGLESTDSPGTSTTSAPLDADEIALAKVAAATATPGTNWQPPSGSTPRNINYLYLQSDAGDPVGEGRTYLYTQANSLLDVQTEGPQLNLVVRGDEFWLAQFAEPAFLTRLKRGLFTNVEALPPVTEGAAGMSIQGLTTCSTVTGWLAVDEVEYEKGKLVAVVLRFAHFCDGNAAALRGKLRWTIGDRTTPPGPVNPPPANLWQPPAGSTPATGSYIYLQGEAGDPLLDNAARLYTKADAQLQVLSALGLVNVSMRGDESWNGSFKAMDKLTEIKPGYYSGLMRFDTYYNPAKGGMVWYGSVSSCGTISGWFVVDAVTFVNGALQTLDLRFEQHCNGIGPALHGKIHWDANDPTQPPGVVNPPPANLWQPAPGTTPAAGNYVYLQSDAGDVIGGGRTYLYTLGNALLGVSATPLNRLSVGVAGSESWTGSFKTELLQPQWQPGYYANASQYAFNNPVKAGLDWSGAAGSCGALTGWIVIDSVSFANNALAAIDLRFEQHCGGGTPALRGKIHWVAADTTGQPQPIFPPPAGLWDAPAGATPATGNYVYLQSDVGDTVGGGATVLLTNANASLNIGGAGPAVFVNIPAGLQFWSGSFAPMTTLAQMQPGYYPNVVRWSQQSPLHAAMEWRSSSRSCNLVTGWFVIDAITYGSGGTVTSLDLRFEQHCEGAGPALHGKIHWSPAAAPAPVFPPPANLWRPAPGATPASGNYVYLESEPGDPVGQGQTLTLTQAQGVVFNAVVPTQFSFSTFTVGGVFQAMSSVPTLVPGYYGDLPKALSNPFLGGLSWSIDGRFCAALTGWFVVDSPRPSLDLRFEQRCEGATGVLRGQIHWVN